MLGIVELSQTVFRRSGTELELVASVTSHLAVLAHIRGNLNARADYIKRLPTDKLNEVLEIIMSNRL